MKKIIRGLFKNCTLLMAIIISLLFIIPGYIANYIGRFSDVSIVLGYIPGYLGENLRSIFYKVMLNKVGKNVVFKFGTYCQYTNITIGNNCFFGYYTTIGCVDIGNDVLCGTHVTFTSGLHQHRFDKKDIPINRQVGEREKIKIGSDIWIGNNCNIANQIGDRCVIGIGSTVVKSLNSHGVYVGDCKISLKNI